LDFDEPAVITVGRAFDCDLCVPSHDDYMNVSRRHGWFEIDPPSIRVFDSDSRNGTFINGVNASDLRETHCDGEDWLTGDLQDGDEVCMGSLVLEVGVCVPDVPPVRAAFGVPSLATSRK
jgi:pSer/pThr/pTyr-binding forkhead associated (FHA) protein